MIIPCSLKISPSVDVYPPSLLQKKMFINILGKKRYLCLCKKGNIITESYKYINNFFDLSVKDEDSIEMKPEV